jgi:hypothetical protein
MSRFNSVVIFAGIPKRTNPRREDISFSIITSGLSSVIIAASAWVLKNG